LHLFLADKFILFINFGMRYLHLLIP